MTWWMILIAGYAGGITAWFGGSVWARKDGRYPPTATIVKASWLWPAYLIGAVAKWIVDEFLEGIRP